MLVTAHVARQVSGCPPEWLRPGHSPTPVNRRQARRPTLYGSKLFWFWFLLAPGLLSRDCLSGFSTSDRLSVTGHVCLPSSRVHPYGTALAFGYPTARAPLALIASYRSGPDEQIYTTNIENFSGNLCCSYRRAICSKPKDLRHQFHLARRCGPSTSLGIRI